MLSCFGLSASAQKACKVDGASSGTVQGSVTKKIIIKYDTTTDQVTAMVALTNSSDYKANVTFEIKGGSEMRDVCGGVQQVMVYPDRQNIYAVTFLISNNFSNTFVVDVTRADRVIEFR